MNAETKTQKPTGVSATKTIDIQVTIKPIGKTGVYQVKSNVGTGKSTTVRTMSGNMAKIATRE